MFRRKLGFVAIALLMVSAAAGAQEAPKWTYVEAGYLDFDPGATMSDSGWYGAGSLKIFKMFHLKAKYNDAGDYTFWNAGIGWHGLLGDPADLFVDVDWRDVKVDTGSGSVSDDGYQASGGVRWNLGKWFQVKGQVNWVDLDQGGSDTTYEAEGVVRLVNDRLGLGVSYETGDADTMRAFARFNFGK